MGGARARARQGAGWAPTCSDRGLGRVPGCGDDAGHRAADHDDRPGVAESRHGGGAERTRSAIVDHDRATSHTLARPPYGNGRRGHGRVPRIGTRVARRLPRSVGTSPDPGHPKGPDVPRSSRPYEGAAAVCRDTPEQMVSVSYSRSPARLISPDPTAPPSRLNPSRPFAWHLPKNRSVRHRF